jgi:cytochrome c peroxidase
MWQSFKLGYEWLGILVFLLVVGCNHPKEKSNQDASIINEINDLFQQQVADFEQHLKDFKIAIESDSSQDFNANFKSTFLSFKQFGFILEYYDAQLYGYFNGAPIAKEDMGNPYPNVITPKGLQVIYELIENPAENKSELLEQVDYLIYQLQFVRQINAQNEITAQAVFNAVQQHLLRFETLSLAGFDNPSLQNEYEYLANELNALNAYLSIAQNAFAIASQSKTPILIQYDSSLVNHKLQFIKEKLYPFKQQLAVFIDSEKEKISPIHPNVFNIYDANFLNASFFSANGMEVHPNDAKSELGKMLFSDPILSNQEVNFSCATCHLPDRFFTDGLKLGKSNIIGTELLRNTPTLIHSAYQNKFMYDGRAASLEEQMLHVFKNEKEFKSNMSEMVTAIASNTEYLKRFQSIYSEMTPSVVNLYSITDALAAYVRTLDGHQSTFDLYMRGAIATIDTAALKGFNLFMGKAKCGTCHFAPTFSGLLPPLFQDSEFENLGVPGSINGEVWTKDTDLGRYHFYTNEAFKHFFKTPTIRNVAETAPYMHNGVFKTLEEVMEFYNNGGGVGHELDYENQSLPSETLQLTATEKDEIIAFMKALTDNRYKIY